MLVELTQALLPSVLSRHASHLFQAQQIQSTWILVLTAVVHSLGWMQMPLPTGTRGRTEQFFLAPVKEKLTTMLHLLVVHQSAVGL
jgi:hypothetical protein